MMNAPKNVLRTTVARPAMSGVCRLRDGKVLALLPVMEAAAPVATVYTEPNFEVTIPGLSPARVIASPPTLLTNVKAFPPIAIKKVVLDEVSNIEEMRLTCSIFDNTTT